MTYPMEQYITKQHKNRWTTSGVYQRLVIHVTIQKDWEDTLEYDRIHLETLCKIVYS